MAYFVLVPGAWLGSWVWQPVVDELRGHGHEAAGVTLAGLAERADVPAAEVGLATHVDDVLAALDGRDDAILVGHSYSGIVVGQAAEQAGERVRHAVYVDANLPVDGESMVASWSRAGRDFVADLVREHGGYWPAPETGDLAGHDLTAEQADWLVGQATPHPGRTLFEPAALRRPMSAASATYLACVRPDGVSAAAVALRAEPTWRVVAMETGHWPMVSAPQELAKLLVEAADASR